MLSVRTQTPLSYEFMLKDLFERYRGNPYDEKNEQGIIDLVTAHNSAVSDLVVEKLNQEDLRTWDASMMPYPPDSMGVLPLRKAMAGFLTRQFNAPTELDPKKFCLMNGVTSVLNNMAYTLCDHGDTILTHSPVYGAIPRDFLFVAGVKTYTATLSSAPGVNSKQRYEMTTDTLESSLKEACEKGHRVKAVLLINPVNPFGTVFTKEQLLDYLQFCKKHGLHCIIDEIYGCSVYDPSVKFTSVLALEPDELPDKDRTHVLWGTAKDFGMPGNPIGAVYSWNPKVLSALACFVDFHQIPIFNQLSVTKLLEDQEWLESLYLPTNRKRLQESSKIVMATFDELGVAYIKPSAGLFIWVDFRKYLPEATAEAERKLTDLFVERGIAIPPSCAFYASEPGWFRIVFSLPRKQLLEAMKRLKEVLTSLLMNKTDNS